MLQEDEQDKTEGEAQHEAERTAEFNKNQELAMKLKELLAKINGQ